MSTVGVRNYGSFEMKAPEGDMTDLERMMDEYKATVIRAASPFVNTVKIFNKTKRCNVSVSFSSGKVVVSITNPDDEIFDINEPDPVREFDQHGDLNATQKIG